MAQLEIVLKVFLPGEELTINEIERRLQGTISRRSLQRYLLGLVEKGHLTPAGKGRARVYSLALLSDRVDEENQRPKVIPYQDQFLLSYKPNKDSYLSLEEKKRLRELGSVLGQKAPAGTYAKNIYQRILIDLSWNSSRLEGNTYTLLETEFLLEKGENDEAKGLTDTQMILNHKAAIDFLIMNAEEISFNKFTVCSLHAILSDNLLGDPADSGRLRRNPVGITGTRYTPLDHPQLIEDFFFKFLERVHAIHDPYEQSLFSLIHLAYLQAFQDVNKRTSRLAANIPFVKENLIPLSFVDVSTESYIKALFAVYEKNNVRPMTDLFIQAYERSAQKYSAIQKTLGEPDRFKLNQRNEIQKCVRKIVLNKIKGNLIIKEISHFTEGLGLSEKESRRLIEIIEEEIISLHEGNIARFRLRPSEFQAWKNTK